MTAKLARNVGLESLLARVLSVGTWLATFVIALGLALPLLGGHGGSPDMTSASTRIVTVGIALFILLPVLRVLLMVIVFIRERDYRFAAIAALVLAIIIFGFALGTHIAKPIPG